MATKKRSSSTKTAAKKKAGAKPAAKKPPPPKGKGLSAPKKSAKKTASKKATASPKKKTTVASKKAAASPKKKTTVASKKAAASPKKKATVASKKADPSPKKASAAPSKTASAAKAKPAGAKGTTAHAASLFDRLSAWVSLFAKRSDVTLVEGPTIAPPEAQTRPMPADMAAMAAHASFVQLAYNLPAPRPVPHRGDPDGFLFLSLKGYPANVHIDLPKHGPFESALELDCDSYGTGKAAFYVAEAKPPCIVWDVDDPRVFPSLEAYLTAGARLAFCDSMPGGSWQQNKKGDHPLHSRSLPKSTPLPVLRDALVAKGATPEMASALVAWLGPDCVLLLER